jgi:hypothetical protein
MEGIKDIEKKWALKLLLNYRSLYRTLNRKNQAKKFA